MVRVFGLTQCSAAKYADGIALQGERVFSSPPPGVRSPMEESRRQARLDFLNRMGRFNPKPIPTAA